jgi:AP2-associated kinase
MDGASVAKSNDALQNPISPVKERPAKPAKPDVIKPQAVRYGQGPTPVAYSKSSSGRSFPVTKGPPPSITPKPSHVSQAQEKPIPTNSTSNGIDGKLANANASSRSSPEKQQSVNSLIARWNQGQVESSKPPAKRGGGYI